jgi:FHA domain
MARTDYVMCEVTDLRTLVEHTYVLDELVRLYSEPVVVGRDRNCDIVLDDPEIEPRHGVVVARSNHRYLEIGDEHRRIDTRMFVVGPFALRLVETDQLNDFGEPPADLAVHFGPRGLGARRKAPPFLEHARHADEQQRLVRAFRATVRRITVLGDGTRRWCEQLFHAHIAALSYATAPRAPLVPGWIEYSSSFEDASARWHAAWSLAETGPFEPSAWAYVHRFAAWVTEHRASFALATFEQALLRPEVALDPAFAQALTHLVAAHLMTSDDPASPVKPLLELAEEGVFAFALPDTGVLLVAPALTEAPVDAAAAALSDLGDPHQRTVFADLLEQRGQLLRATRIRQGKTADDRPRVDEVDKLFGGAAALFLPHRKHGMPEAKPVMHEASGTPPAAIFLEHDGVTYPLAATSALAIRGEQLVVLDFAREAGSRVGAILTYDDPVLWLRMHEYAHLRINGVVRHTSQDIPLYDRDVIELDQRRLVVRITVAR